MSEKRTVQVTVNGKEYEGVVEPRKLLSDFLRDELGLTGTHVGCEHGVCGACTVMVEGEAKRSCLLFAVQADGKELRTVEGLAEDGQKHPLQEAFKEKHALQCGFCTPGFLVSGVWLLEEDSDPDPEEVQQVLGGQLCRCTGYENIVEAMESAIETMSVAEE